MKGVAEVFKTAASKTVLPTCDNALNGGSPKQVAGN